MKQPMKIKLSKYSLKLLLTLKEHLGCEDSDVIEEAIVELFEKYVKEGKIENPNDSKSLSLMESLENAGLLDRDFKCVINSSGEEHYVNAKTEEDAWEKMAIRFPNQVSKGFTIEEYDEINLNLFL